MSNLQLVLEQVLSNNVEQVQECKSFLESQYNQNHYHTLDHIEQGLFELKNYYGKIPNYMAWAWLFHDIYQGGDEWPGINELYSGYSAFAYLVYPYGPRLSGQDAGYVYDLIQYTTHNKPLEFASKLGKEASILCDVDLSSIGYPYEVFINNTRLIRLEYSRCTDEEFRQGRIKILQGFLARPRIFHNLYFSRYFEKQARDNITRWIEENEYTF